MVAKIRTSLASGASIIIIGLGCPLSQSMAQGDAAPAASAGGLEEIIVTPQKRAQDIQTVGISMTAFSGAEILDRGISSSVDLVTRTPSVDNYSPYGPGSSANIVIRGIGLNDFGEGNEAPVTVYVDEFYLLSVPAVDFSLFDLERAEILRGPQGTLFGRNSTGGSVQFVTHQPVDTFGGFLKFTYASFGEAKGEGAINVPINDSLYGRLSFLTHHSDGYIRNLNPALPEGGQAGTDAIRGQLRYVRDGWDIDFKTEYGWQDRPHTYYQQIPSTLSPTTGLASLNPGGTDAAGYNPARYGADQPNVAYTSSPQRLKSDALTELLRVKDDFGDMNFTSITGFMHLTRTETEDCDASPNNTCAAIFPYASDTTSEELRLFYDGGDLRSTVGLYGLYATARNNPAAVFNVPESGPGAVDPATGLYDGAYFPLSLAANWHLRTTSVAAFDQTEYKLRPDLTLIAGIRLTLDDKHFTDSDNASLRSCPNWPIPTNCYLAPQGPGIAHPYSASYEKGLVSAKLELDYQATPDTLVYGSISRGSKAGGFNNGFYPAGIKPYQIPYPDEAMIDYELGEKATLLDRRLRIDTSAFYYDYYRFQTFNWEGVGGLLTDHGAESYGAEAELEAAPIEHLSAKLGLSWLETKIRDVANSISGSDLYIANRQMANAPKWTANGSLSYTVPLPSSAAVVLNWDWNYRTSRYTNNFNDPSVKLPGYFEHNLDITYQPDADWQVQFFIRNIGNNQAPTKAFQFNDLGYTQFIYAEPRVFGGSLSYNW